MLETQKIEPKTYIPPWAGGILGRRPYRSQPLPKSVHGTRVGAHRSQPLPKSVHGTQVGAHRSQPLPKSVHGTQVGAHRSQPLPKSVHGTRAGAHRSQPLPKSVSPRICIPPWRWRQHSTDNDSAFPRLGHDSPSCCRAFDFLKICIDCPGYGALSTALHNYPTVTVVALVPNLVPPWVCIVNDTGTCSTACCCVFFFKKKKTVECLFQPVPKER